MKKICTECNQEKNTSNFTKDSYRADGLCVYCKQCKRIKDSVRYNRNDQYKAAQIKRDKNRSAKNREFLIQFKSNGCSHCSETDPSCLDLHHLSEHEKEFTIARQYNCSFERFCTEVQKCIVLCSNCHRKLHAKLKITGLGTA